MKTRLALLITAALLAVGLPVPAHADTLFLYSISDGEATITGYNGVTPTELVIPAGVTVGNDTYPVTTIGYNAFEDDRLTKLTLPNTIKIIGGYAFRRNQLTEVTLPDSVTTVYLLAFYDNKLAELVVPAKVTLIDHEAFYGQNPLHVRFSGAAPELGRSALGRRPTVRFPWRLGDPRAAGGYTTPSWKGYDAIAVADVTFAAGDDIMTQAVDVGAAAAEPRGPVRAGQIFTGWFADDATTPFDFTTAIAGDMTLTAGYRVGTAPVLTGTRTAPVKLGDAFEWTPTTLSGDLAPTVTATGLPDGLEIDSDTGAISGTVTDPALAGDHDVTITATNDIDPDATFELTISIEYFTSSIADGEATITGHHGPAPTALVIPKTIDTGGQTYPVTAIGNGAFSYAELTSVTFPDTLTTIGASALEYNQLTSVTIPDSVTSIGGGAFHGNQLTDIDFGTGVATIGHYSVHQNPDLASVRFRGPAPTMPGSEPLGSSRPVVRYPWKYGSDQVDGGYTPGSWKGYDSVAVADVTFTGGGDIAPQSVDVDYMAVAAKPADPAKAGHRFTGWFADSATTPFDFTAPITGDTALTAGFEAEVAPVLTGSATATVKLGDAFEWTPTTLAGYPIPTVTATGLPDGLEIDSETGAIRGTVTDAAMAGDHGVRITATNGIDPDTTFELTISIEYFTSSIADGEATITGYHGAAAADLVIPGEITNGNDSYPVTTINHLAFRNHQLTDLTLPDGITSIGVYAFADNLLSELVLPGTLTTISSYAFANNPGLDGIRFAGPAPQLGDGALGTGDPTVRFRWKLGDPRAPGGYTTPLWHGYDTTAVADVTFAGGGDIAPQSVDIDGISTVLKPAPPAPPAQDGYVFTGWFSDTATAPFDFANPIAGDVALTARFGIPGVPGPEAPVPDAPIPDAPISPSDPADPAVTGLAPAITGKPHEGKTLTAKPGPVGPAGATVAYQWLANGQIIKGATKPSIKLGKAHAGKRITVTITATRATAPAVTKTSTKTKIVSSAKRRIVVSSRKVGKNQPVTVTATGFKARQKITIWLGKNKRYTGRADSRGIITKTVTFAKGAKAGNHRVRVTSQAKGGRTQTVQTTVRYR